MSSNNNNNSSASAQFPCIGIFRFLCEGEEEEPLPGSPAQNAKSPTGFQTQLVLCTSVGVLCFLLFCVLRTRLVIRPLQSGNISY